MASTSLPALCATLGTAFIGSFGVGVVIDLATNHRADVPVLAASTLQPGTRHGTHRKQAHGIAGTYRQHSDGLFYVDGQLNDQPVRFVVDTGASITVLSHADATRLGLTRDARGELQTAAGIGGMQWTTINRLKIAGHHFNAMDAAISEADMPASLLGQDVLGQFASVTLEGDRLTIE